MKNKWLLVSSVSTVIGIAAGVVYLFFAEHSLLLSDNAFSLSAFWSTFMLWVFVLMFVVAVLCNVVAFIELDDEHRFAGIHQRLRDTLTSGSRQQRFLLEATQLLHRKGLLLTSARVAAEYQLLAAQRDTLVFIQTGFQPVNIEQVRAMFQQMLAAELIDGIVVASAGFSNQAWIFAAEANITLWDSKSLKKQYKRAKMKQIPIIQS